MQDVNKMLFYVLFHLCYFMHFASSTENCNKPDKTLGQCISIKNCPEVLDMITKRPLLDKDKEYIKQFQCGWDKTLPKVCCNTNNTSMLLLPEYNKSVLLPNENECGFTVTNKFIGGEIAELDDFPWSTILEYEIENRKELYCGGTLISNRYVITAAHCVNKDEIPKGSKLVSVRLGEYDINSDIDCELATYSDFCADPAISVGIEEVVIHEEYSINDVNKHNDIALLRLNRSISFSDFTQPICILPTGKIRSYAMVTGWRLNPNNHSLQSNIKLKMRVMVQSNYNCTLNYNKLNITDNQLCVGKGEETRPFSEDSGGALINMSMSSTYELRGFIIGIKSFELEPFGTKGRQTVYTKVNNYISWILSKLKI